MPKKNPYIPEFFVSADEEKKIQEQVRNAEQKAMQEKVENISQKYNYSYVGMEEVIKNPDEYIIPELQNACKKLWEMNIFTFMCSNRNDGGYSYIILEKLSDENQEIFNNLSKKYPKNFIFDHYRNAYRIDCFTEKMSEKGIAKKFDFFIKDFKPQDVQDKFYITKEEFLISCGCFKEIPNPNYVENVGPMPTTLSLKDLDAWFAKADQPKTIKVFDESKVVKPIEQYLKEKGVKTYDPETQRIYVSEFFLNRHLDYVAKTKAAETNATI